jgi:hypothetical protein
MVLPPVCLCFWACLAWGSGGGCHVCVLLCCAVGCAVLCCVCLSVCIYVCVCAILCVLCVCDGDNAMRLRFVSRLLLCVASLYVRPASTAPTEDQPPTANPLPSPSHSHSLRSFNIRIFAFPLALVVLLWSTVLADGSWRDCVCVRVRVSSRSLLSVSGRPYHRPDGHRVRSFTQRGTATIPGEGSFMPLSLQRAPHINAHIPTSIPYRYAVIRHVPTL